MGEEEGGGVYHAVKVKQAGHCHQHGQYSRAAALASKTRVEPGRAPLATPSERRAATTTVVLLSNHMASVRVGVCPVADIGV